mmetsp:Transcript_9825/g.16081  ORF Transcript_9825/g.16081 Transcript_9825/m.16081 type:complete len:290 (-) Transcript_9825:119-988(-)|eukprot:CAMPEP_0203756290 /NCGR_PEP_ID=MMETSP0098-20131031/9586_1 /ASSEMBLY_ACC=CAM_ASM_000208 /TAXON_ID=96639 /ORGANISM=" , Strain NY0313808BC1" /LENGTH=289 /DNA_ID=CAMNT_0050648113 /DNA_START=33 /DNA_END=902 /DNA_ORIENTATION=+
MGSLLSRGLEEDSFADKVVWVVGGSSGLGKEVGCQFHAHGANVIMSARRGEILEGNVGIMNVKRASSARALKFDVASVCDTESANAIVSKALDCFGRIDVIVLCAGISNRGMVMETDISVEKRLFDVNFFSHVALTKAILPVFFKQRTGTIVPVSSVHVFFGSPARAPYCASKAAIHRYFESLRSEVPDWIRINILCPGYIKTELSLRALTVDTKSENNKMDPSTEKGFPPSYVAIQALKGILNNKATIIIAQTTTIVAMNVQRFLPWGTALISFILKKKGRALVDKAK